MSLRTEGQRAGGACGAAKAILSDIHFLIPLGVLLVGVALLVVLH